MLLCFCLCFVCFFTLFYEKRLKTKTIKPKKFDKSLLVLKCKFCPLLFFSKKNKAKIALVFVFFSHSTVQKRKFYDVLKHDCAKFVCPCDWRYHCGFEWWY